MKKVYVLLLVSFSLSLSWSAISNSQSASSSLSSETSVSLSAASGKLNPEIEKLREAYLKAGGPEKALIQLSCFLKSHSQKTFQVRPVSGKPDSEIYKRCHSQSQLQLFNQKVFAVVDYTHNSDRARLFIFDLRVGELRKFHVGHGRFGETDRNNTQFSNDPKHNSILKVGHFSNEINSNASAGGFYLTGQEYQGQYGRSLVLHGLEKSINDNACERMTVIHKSSMIDDNSTRRMSSGCPMVPVNRIDYIVQGLGLGGLVYIYTPNEAALPNSVCGRNLWTN